MTNTDPGMPDKKFPIIWTAFLLGFIILFGVFETWALMTGGTTLSRYTYEVTKAWPPMIFILGFVSGGLCVHFWWHWSPPGSEDGG